MDQRPEEKEGEGRRRISSAQKRLIGFIVVLAVTNVAYRLVYATGASRTAALYVGVPTILAVGLALLPHKGSATGRVAFGVDRDATMLARWADLERAVVTWEPVDGTRTRVTWTLEYRRLIYPTAYFAPLQRFGMGQAAGYLLDATVVEQLP